MLPILSKISLAIALITLLGCREETSRLGQFAVHGIDVSHYQRRISWEKVVDQGVDFVFIKATEGGNYNDSIFLDNWAGAKNVGLKRGAYHFFRPRVSARQQAANFLKHVPIEAGDLPPVLDVEVMDGVAADRLKDSVRLWLELVRQTTGAQPILYTNLNFYQQHLSQYFHDIPLWLARYNHKEPYIAGKEWHFWQYGNRGRLEGIDGFVDFNVFKGSMEDLERFTLRYTNPEPAGDIADPEEMITAP